MPSRSQARVRGPPSLLPSPRALPKAIGSPMAAKSFLLCPSVVVVVAACPQTSATFHLNRCLDYLINLRHQPKGRGLEEPCASHEAGTEGRREDQINSFAVCSLQSRALMQQTSRSSLIDETTPEQIKTRTTARRAIACRGELEQVCCAFDQQVKSRFP